MDKHTNIATYPITNSVTGLNMRNLFTDDLLLNSKDERENRGTNKDNDNTLFEEKLTTIDTNLQPETSDPPIPINLNLDSTLPSSNITATHPISCRAETKKARLNANIKLNTGFHIPAINDLDLSSYNSANGSSIHKQGPKDIFTFMKLINEASEK